MADSGLFLAEQLEVDGVGVVGLQQLAALTIEAQQFSVKLLKLVDGLALAVVISTWREARSWVSQGWGSWMRS